MSNYKDLNQLRFWCQKVLPLVYDDSLSYYEVLAKMCAYINDMVENDKSILAEMDILRSDVKEADNWINNFDAGKIVELEKIVGDFLKVAVMFELTDSGYLVARIPSTWDAITFGTTGLDTELASDGVYGRLTLSY